MIRTGNVGTEFDSIENLTKTIEQHDPRRITPDGQKMGEAKRLLDKVSSMLIRLRQRYLDAETKMDHDSGWMKANLTDLDGAATHMVTAQKLNIKRNFMMQSEANNTRMGKLFTDMIREGARGVGATREDMVAELGRVTDAVLGPVHGFPGLEARYREVLMNVSHVSEDVTTSFKDFDDAGHEFDEFWDDVRSLESGQGGLGDLTRGVGEATDNLLKRIDGSIQKFRADMRLLHRKTQQDTDTFGHSSLELLQRWLEEAAGESREFASFAARSLPWRVWEADVGDRSQLKAGNN
jgi:hypothetical protein